MSAMRILMTVFNYALTLMEVFIALALMDIQEMETIVQVCEMV